MSPVPSKPRKGAKSRAQLSQTQKAFKLQQRRDRVKRACERCRAKKIKCDAECPCKRCKLDNLICTAPCSRGGAKFPRYPNILENTQQILIDTVFKLYEMLRAGDEWKLEDPDSNGLGRPLVHSIAERLGMTRQSQVPPSSLDCLERDKGIYSPNLVFDTEINEQAERDSGLSLSVTPRVTSSSKSEPEKKPMRVDTTAKASLDNASQVSWSPTSLSMYRPSLGGCWGNLAASTSSSLGSSSQTDISSLYLALPAQFKAPCLPSEQATTLAQSSLGPTMPDKNANAPLDIPQCLQSFPQLRAGSFSTMGYPVNDARQSVTTTFHELDADMMDLDAFNAWLESPLLCDTTYN